MIAAKHDLNSEASVSMTLRPMTRVMALSLSESRVGQGMRMAMQWGLPSQSIKRWNDWIISIVP
jgi:hypothetical protein